MGIAPRQADEMEVWEVASVLGMARPPDQQATQGDVRSEGAKLIEERMRRHAMGLPPPGEAEAIAPSETELARLSTLIPTND